MAQELSVSDPALAAWFGASPVTAGVPVNERTALGVSAFYRGVSLISTTIAGLPLKAYRDVTVVDPEDDEKRSTRRESYTSWLDAPNGPHGPTPFEWKERALLHMVLQGEAIGKRIYNGAGTMIGADWIHPLMLSVDWEIDTWGQRTGRRLYRGPIGPHGQVQTLTSDDVLHVMGPSVDGLRGLSVIRLARESLGTTIAGERAAANLFGSGGLMSGLVTPEDDDLDPDDVSEIKEQLNAKASGWEHAGELALVNRRLKFTPWTMSAEDAQFIASREFQVTEVARWLGIPPHLLMQTEKQTSWGTGVESQNRGLAKFSLMGWTKRFEERISRLFPSPRFVEFEYAGLERPTPEQEIDLLIKQVKAGLLTINEARAVRNLPPLSWGDERTPARTDAGTDAGADQTLRDVLT